MRFALLLSTVMLLQAQSGAPKTKAADYPVHVQLDTVTIAAEYLVHSVPTLKGMLIARDYLVVDVAFFGPRFSRLKVSGDNFTLRINRKGGISTEAPGMVSGSIKFPDQTAHPQLTGTGSVGMNDGTISVGPRAPQSRFPGDGGDRVPANQAPTVKEVDQESDIDHRVLYASLHEGENPLPSSGLIYFYFRGKIKNIHSLELLYDGTMGKATLKLLP